MKGMQILLYLMVCCMATSNLAAKEHQNHHHTGATGPNATYSGFVTSTGIKVLHIQSDALIGTSKLNLFISRPKGLDAKEARALRHLLEHVLMTNSRKWNDSLLAASLINGAHSQGFVFPAFTKLSLSSVDERFLNLLNRFYRQLYQPFDKATVEREVRLIDEEFYLLPQNRILSGSKSNGNRRSEDHSQVGSRVFFENNYGKTLSQSLEKLRIQSLVDNDVVLVIHSNLPTSQLLESLDVDLAPHFLKNPFTNLTVATTDFISRRWDMYLDHDINFKAIEQSANMNGEPSKTVAYAHSGSGNIKTYKNNSEHAFNAEINIDLTAREIGLGNHALAHLLVSKINMSAVVGSVVDVESNWLLDRVSSGTLTLKIEGGIGEPNKIVAALNKQLELLLINEEDIKAAQQYEKSLETQRSKSFRSIAATHFENLYQSSSMKAGSKQTHQNNKAVGQVDVEQVVGIFKELCIEAVAIGNIAETNQSSQLDLPKCGDFKGALDITATENQIGSHYSNGLARLLLTRDKTLRNYTELVLLKNYLDYALNVVFKEHGDSYYLGSEVFVSKAHIGFFIWVESNNSDTKTLNARYQNFEKALITSIKKSSAAQLHSQKRALEVLLDSRRGNRVMEVSAMLKDWQIGFSRADADKHKRKYLQEITQDDLVHLAKSLLHSGDVDLTLFADKNLN